MALDTKPPSIFEYAACATSSSVVRASSAHILTTSRIATALSAPGPAIHQIASRYGVTVVRSLNGSAQGLGPEAAGDGGGWGGRVVSQEFLLSEPWGV